MPWFVAVHFCSEPANQLRFNRSKGDAVEMDRAASLGLSLAELKQLDKRTNDFDQSIKKIDLDLRKNLTQRKKANARPIR